jgi:hypothetical protein
MNKLFLSGFLIALTFGMPIEQANTDTQISFHPNATNQTCHLCENIVNIISVEDKALNKTIVEIIKIMRGVCEKINGPSGKECIAVLDDIEQIIIWIAHGLTAPVICHKLGFCSNTTHTYQKDCISDL